MSSSDEEEIMAEEEEMTGEAAVVVEDEDDDEDAVDVDVDVDVDATSQGDEESIVQGNATEDDEDDTKSDRAEEDSVAEQETLKEEKEALEPTTPPKRSRKRPPPGSGGSKKGRAPAVSGLTIPFRAVKRTMKLDRDIATVQNEAAIVATLAAELFLKDFAKESQRNAKTRGRNTIRYEDVSEARTKNPALDFLETLLP